MVRAIARVVSFARAHLSLSCVGNWPKKGACSSRALVQGNTRCPLLFLSRSGFAFVPFIARITHSAARAREREALVSGNSFFALSSSRERNTSDATLVYSAEMHLSRMKVSTPLPAPSLNCGQREFCYGGRAEE